MITALLLCLGWEAAHRIRLTGSPAKRLSPWLPWCASRCDWSPETCRLPV